jgi:hypothetical protein
MISMRPRYRTVTLFGVLLLTGCAPATSTVTGTVTLNGKPVTEGQVSFIFADGMVVTAMIQADGSYMAPEVPVGPARVAVYGPAVAQAEAEIIKVKGKEGGKARTPPKAAKGDIPDRYSNPDTSGLSVTVTKGETKYEIPLTP